MISRDGAVPTLQYGHWKTMKERNTLDKMKRSRTAPHDTINGTWSTTAKFQMPVDAFVGVCELGRVSSSGIVHRRNPAYWCVVHDHDLHHSACVITRRPIISYSFIGSLHHPGSPYNSSPPVNIHETSTTCFSHVSYAYVTVPYPLQQLLQKSPVEAI